MSFRLFGSDHLASLESTAVLAAVLIRLVRRDPERRLAWGLRRALAGLLLASAAAVLLHEQSYRALSVWDFLPLQLCDFLILVAAYALLTLRPTPLYLRRKPEQPTLLDWLGPWPVYIAGVALIGLALFAAMAWPFRRGRS